MAGRRRSGARRAAHRNGVELFGDLPFMVDGDSADVWARQDQFRLDASVGVPPDAFSATGQDWGMPPYRWDVIAGEHFALAARARRGAAPSCTTATGSIISSASIAPTPGRKGGGEPLFTPPDEPTQTTLGERMLAIFRERGLEIIAEDLGTVPDFVRASLARSGRARVPRLPLGTPLARRGQTVPRSSGLSRRVGRHFRHARHRADGRLVGQHVDRRAAARSSRSRRCGAPPPEPTSPSAPFNPAVRDALLEALFASGSNILLLPVTDVFGWPERINEPATTGADNWTYRLPWPVDRLGEIPDAVERQTSLARWARESGR